MFLKTFQPDFSYQTALQEAVYKHLVVHPNQGCVLAAAPGAGKTNMALRVLDRYLTEFPKQKALVLTHGQRLLRSQFFDRLQEVGFPHESVELTREVVDARVHVALPHFFEKKPVEASYGIIVIDEAHHFYTAPMVQRILARNSGARLLLLTGSPSGFIREGRFPLEMATACELLEYGVLSDPYVELVQTNLPFTMEDYNAEEDLRDGVEMDETQVDEALSGAMDSLCGAIKKRLQQPVVKASSHAHGLAGKLLRQVLPGAQLGKTLVVCNSQGQARAAWRWFQRSGIETLISTSDTDRDSDAIEIFKTGTASVLVVVQRATLGFDFSDLMNVVDISCSMNPDRIFQTLCRVVRRSGSNPGAKKMYIKVSPINTAILTHHVMGFVMALGDRRVCSTYNGDWKSASVPKRCDVKKVVEKHQKTTKAAKNGRSTPKILLPHFYTFQEIRHVYGGALEAYAWSSFTETKRWMSEERCRAQGKKRQLLEMAKNGEPRPHYLEAPLGKVLHNYTHPSSTSYDPDFTKEIKELRPDWFVRVSDVVQEKKQQLLEMAKNGEPRPNPQKHVLGGAFYTYVHAERGDPDFKKKIMELRPDWFVSRSGVLQEKKQQLLEMAKNGEPRPKPEVSLAQRSLSKVLLSLTSPKGRHRNPGFIKKLRELRPDWFSRTAYAVREKKRQLLEMAKNGEPRPKLRTHPLGGRLIAFTGPSSGSYDPDFTKEIRKLRPDWFRR